MLKSVDSINFSEGSGHAYKILDHVWQSPFTAFEAIKKTGKHSIFYKIGCTPWFLNGKLSSRSEVLAEIEKSKTKGRPKIKVTFCTDESMNFEKAVSIRIFSSGADFERSPFCRHSVNFTDEQKEKHKLLTK